jgi:hypothetical protein
MRKPIFSNASKRHLEWNRSKLPTAADEFHLTPVRRGS